MVAVDRKLFIFGGDIDIHLDHPSSVERCDPESDQWEKMVSPMLTRRWGLAAAALRGWIYVCGGSDGTNLSVCECYDHRRDRWQTVASMRKTCYGPILVVLNERLYALRGSGGWNSAEVYDVNKNEWTLLPQKLIRDECLLRQSFIKRKLLFLNILR